MAELNDSILTTTKKALMLAEGFTEFDPEIIMHINSVFSVLNQLGVGPEEGFSISDKTTLWTEFIEIENLLNLVKSYMYLKVRLIFDPPATSFVITSFEKMASEYEFRMNVIMEGKRWTAQTTS